MGINLMLLTIGPFKLSLTVVNMLWHMVPVSCW